MSEIEIRTAQASEYETFRTVFAAAMMFEPSFDELSAELFEPERALVATDDGKVIGTTRVLTRDLSVPGAVVDAAHVTSVGVLPTHRRRGVMSGLIGRQLREVPEAIAVLWASEPAIYGRFGYATSSWKVGYEADLHRVGPPNDRLRPGELGELTTEDALKELPPILRRLQEQRPGVSSRTEPAWRKHLEDKPEDRHGWNALRILVHRDESGTIDGYALWRGKINWTQTGPLNEVLLEELAAPEPAAYKAIWQYLLTMDLSGKLGYGFASVDEALVHLVATPTALDRRLGEGLWVRVTDVPRALSQRRYSVPLDVVLEVTDDLIAANTGRFRLTADGAAVTCVRTEDAADLSLSVTELGATYLGARSLAEFVPTGRVIEHTPGVLSQVSAAFRWAVAPVSLEIF
ncbi:GNAT family N-acetyltransferase [Kribbella solani]|uniref:GNAT family N-acetyltransferase n=1 Tax=Kribbella solani TaxID=236067 RepID=UPI0029B11DA0|nr:GNAT family N-acetyltransferase [Kribbella solani]MDX3002662.1 GNAT family N-acetyltransferase [Kribbella solani]